MYIAEIVGNIVSSQKNPHLSGNRLLIAQPLDLQGEETGPELIALDRVDAGEGDRVLLVEEGGSSRIAFSDDQIPIQAFVLAVIDSVEINKEPQDE